MTSCGKDIDPKVDKIDLARLLDDNEIATVFKKINENFNSISKMEINASMIEDDLINQRTETTASGSVTIKGDQYSENKSEMTTKVKNNFYTYTSKTVSEGKTAAFGEYYVTMNEVVKDGQKEIKASEFEYINKGSLNIVEASTTLSFSPSSFGDVTFGVDRSNNVYAVYNKQTLNTSEGKDKDGKDASFIDRETHETFAKLGNIKNPRIESLKVVGLYEANYDEELNIYKNYQTVESSVVSYKFEYKNRGNNDGMDKFINSLPDKYISYAAGTMNRYSVSNGNQYTLVGQESLWLTSFKSASYASNVTSFKSESVTFAKDYAYNFEVGYAELNINKSSKEITSTAKELKSVLVYGSGDMEAFTGFIDGKSTSLVKVKEGKSSSKNIVHFLIDPNANDLVIYLV